MSYLLCIDIGNTHVVAALLQGDDVAAEIRIPSRPMQTTNIYRSGLESLFSDLQADPLADIEGSVISSVVPRLTDPFTAVCHKLTNNAPLIVDHKLPLDLKIRYDDPSEVGADRICNAAGALRLYTAPLIVVDMGTATTFDIVGRNREYLGGVIMPGLETAGHDLFERAARLTEVHFAFPDKIIGSNTRESLQSGLMWGTIAQIDGLITMICDEWKETSPTVIATGGLSEVLAPHSRYIQHVNKTLTLTGMREIWEQLQGEFL
jgi:type III pantothenate kinase